MNNNSDQFSAEKATDAPGLSVDTSTISPLIGRLYHSPEFILPETLDLEFIKNAVKYGYLFPSTTNILNVRNTPQLVPWASWITAKEMIEFAIEREKYFNTRIKKNKYGAINYFKEAPNRFRDFSAIQGSNVHYAIESLVKTGELPQNAVYTNYEKRCIDAWKKWADIFQPTYKYVEITGFGKTEDNMKYGQTTDGIIELNNELYAIDNKCVVDDTLILLETGETVQAKNLKQGDRIVAWTKENNLQVSTVASVEDNGFKQVATISTASGHKVTTTLNHKFLASHIKNTTPQWIPASDLQTGSYAYLAGGWGSSPNRVINEKSYPYNKHLSPYITGVLWALGNFATKEWKETNFSSLPPIARLFLQEELVEAGFVIRKPTQTATEEKLDLKSGLKKIAHKASRTLNNPLEVEDLKTLFTSPEIPPFIQSGDRDVIFAFITGLKEVFKNPEVSKENTFIVLSTHTALVNLLQFLLNYGILAKFKKERNQGLEYVIMPNVFKEDELLYGLVADEIVDIKIHNEPEHTIAVEVNGSHTHVTNGLITHNTNRKGLHADVALQLAANVRCTEWYPDNKTKTTIPPIRKAAGLHLSPQGFTFQEVDISDEVFNIFAALRRVWNFHAFTGKLNSQDGVFGRKLNSPKDLD